MISNTCARCMKAYQAPAGAPSSWEVFPQALPCPGQARQSPHRKRPEECPAWPPLFRVNRLYLLICKQPQSLSHALLHPRLAKPRQPQQQQHCIADGAGDRLQEILEHTLKVTKCLLSSGTGQGRCHWMGMPFHNALHSIRKQCLALIKIVAFCSLIAREGNPVHIFCRIGTVHFRMHMLNLICERCCPSVTVAS